MNKVLDVKASIMNCPDMPLKTGYLVARLVDSVLWYYGFYPTAERALSIAVELGNGVVFGVLSQEGEEK